MLSRISISRTFTTLIALALVLVLLLAQVTPARAARGDTIRMSVDSSGAQADDPPTHTSVSSNPSISGDGRYVAFDSFASNLVSGDTNIKNDVFVRDALSETTTLISRATGVSGAQGNEQSSAPSISSDGRYIAFYSYASNLVSGDTNGQSDIYLRDTQLNTTTRISVSTSGTQANNASYNPSISANGRYVVFQSVASNLVGGDVNGVFFDVFMRDTQLNTTTLISRATGVSGLQTNAASLSPVVSSDGHYVAFYSSATNLVSGDTNGKDDVFVRDTVANTTTRISVDSSELQGDDESTYPAISSTGRYVAFVSATTNLVSGDTNGAPDIFVRDTTAGTTSRISMSTGDLEANSDSYKPPAISADGRFVAFASAADNLVGGDNNNVPDLFVRDRDADTNGTYDEGGGVSTIRVTLDTSLAEADSDSYNPSIALDGSGATEGYYVAFNSNATNLVSDDTNQVSDVFLHDRRFSADNTAPTVTINQKTSAPAQADPSVQFSASPINFTAVFSESIKASTFIGADLTLTGTAGTLSAVITQIAPNDGTTFNIAVSGMSGDGTVIASMNTGKVTDLSGNPNTASSSLDNSVTYDDQTPPSVAMSSTSATPINGAITVKVTFSENVTGFALTDITVANGAKSNFIATSGAIYTFTLTPTTDGLVTADIAASVAQDPALNNNTVAPQFSRTYDGIPPTTSLLTNPPNPDSDNTPTFTFNGGDTSPGVVASFQCKMDSGSYATCVSPFTSSTLVDGAHTFNVRAVDNASNVDASPASYTWTVDTVAPTVISSTLANPNPSSSLSVSFTVTFSESVTGVDAADFTLTTTGVTGASITSVSSDSGATRTVTVATGSNNGTIRLDVLDNDTILDGVAHPLNGAFSSGQVYTLNKVLTVNSSGAQDGWILESSETSSIGSTMNTSATTFRLGDDTSKKQYRAILSFSTGAGLPDNAVITSITLRLKRSGVAGGGNPVTAFQGFMADVKKGFFFTKLTLQSNDFQALAGKTFGPYKPALVGGWYGINLTGAKNYVNKVATSSGLTQIRLRFKVDDNNNAAANYLSLFSGNAPTASRPQLIIKYYVP